MVLDPSKLGYVSLLIRDAPDIKEVERIWFSHIHEVYGARLIYANPQPVGIVLPSSKWSIKTLTDAYPRCLYSTDYLYLLDDEIINRPTVSGKIPVSVDPSIMLDSNVAEEIKRFVKELPSNHPDGSIVIDFIASEDVNFSYHQYLYENAKNYYLKPGHAGYVRETLFYIKWFDYINKDNYRKTGDRGPELDETLLWREVDKELDKFYGTRQHKELLKDQLRMHYLIYLVLLKIVEVEFTPVRKPFEMKLETLLNFMHEHLHRIYLRELLMATRYFRRRSDVSFMNKINKSCDNPLARLSNIAWDMMLFRIMEKLATLRTPGGPFIPYFISFDEPARRLFETYRLKGLIAYGDEGAFISIPQTDYIKNIIEEVKDPAMQKKLSWYFSRDNVKLRRSFTSRRIDSPPRSFVRNLERKVWRECLESPE